ncbi:MAG TPA: peptidase [Caulobacteraceae bacterium]|jgi:putative proteasome-type protease|nr:peptidase [Caulobacteraceae bacterium]
MTYCLGILVRDGLVLASDSRSNAGVDQVTRVKKLTVLARTPERIVCLQSAGNLATTQEVEAQLRKASGSGTIGRDILAAETFFDVAGAVGDWLREVTEADRKYVEPYSDVTAAFLVSGQIEGEPRRLFQVYPAGNFVEAGDRAPFLQIGETKYGRPILDRALRTTSSLDEAAKLALLSFDATLRSNLSVGQPIDLLRYRADSFGSAEIDTFEDDDPYWRDLSVAYSRGLAALVDSLPSPPAV